MKRIKLSLLLFASCSPSSFFKEHRTKVSLGLLASITLICLYKRSKNSPKPSDNTKKPTLPEEKKTEAQENNSKNITAHLPPGLETTFQKDSVDISFKEKINTSPAIKLPTHMPDTIPLAQKSSLSSTQTKAVLGERIVIKTPFQTNISQETTWKNLLGKKYYTIWNATNIIFKNVDSRMPASEEYSLSIKPAGLRTINFHVSKLESLMTLLAQKKSM